MAEPRTGRVAVTRRRWFGVIAAAGVAAAGIVAGMGTARAEPAIECPGVQWATSTYHLDLGSGWRLLVHPKSAYAEVQPGNKSLLVCNYDNGAKAVFEVGKRCRAITQRGMSLISEADAGARRKISCSPQRNKTGSADFDCAFTCE
jgi:hypothetical protein